MPCWCGRLRRPLRHPPEDQTNDGKSDPIPKIKMVLAIAPSAGALAPPVTAMATNCKRGKPKRNHEPPPAFIASKMVYPTPINASPTINPAAKGTKLFDESCASRFTRNMDTRQPNSIPKRNRKWQIHCKPHKDPKPPWVPHPVKSQPHHQVRICRREWCH